MRAYFGVIGDVAGMWEQLSESNVLPGLRIVDDMCFTQGDLESTRDRAARLHQWAKYAQQDVKRNKTEVSKAFRFARISRLLTLTYRSVRFFSMQ